MLTRLSLKVMIRSARTGPTGSSISRLTRFSTTVTCNSWVPDTYPRARRCDHLDTYKSTRRGTVEVADPYRWMEEYTPELDKWTSAQETYTRGYIDQNPHRKRLEDAFMASLDYARAGAPVKSDGKRWYWYYNSGLQPQHVYYRSKDGQLPDRSKGMDNGEVFMDLNLLSEDGTASVTVDSFSDDGEYHAYGVSYSGSDFTTVYIRRTDSPLATKEQAENDTGRLPDVLNYVKFSSLIWTPDSKGFFYQRYPGHAHPEGEVNTSGIATKGDKDAMLYYHRLNTPQSEDVLVYHDKTQPDWMYGINVTDDDKYVVMSIVQDTSRRNLLWIAELKPDSIEKGFKWNKLIDNFEAEYDVIKNEGPVFYLRTNKDASNYKVVTIDTSKGNECKPLISESDGFLESIAAVNKGKHFVLTYKRNVKDEVYVYSEDGKEVERLMPDFIGAAYVTARWKDSWFFVNGSGFTTPGTLGQYDFDAPEGQRWSVYHNTQVSGLDPNEFEAKQEWYESKDGTKIPMFIVRHKSTPFDGTAPAIEYGYGGFNVPVSPFFSPIILTFLKTYGVVFTVANIRGGGEFGEDWHQGGMLERKQNCFDDFIAGAEFLVKNKYAAPGKVAINGGSNGGLLVAACVNQAPEGTFGAAIADVGVHDLLRFHKFTIGKAWTSDYGNPDDPKDFDFLYPISPLHNVSSTKVLPPYMLATADHDDRVVPSHSFKLAATLQHLRADNPNPILLRVDKKAGHGAGKSTQKRVEEAADKWGFVAQSLGLDWKDNSDKAQRSRL